MSCEHKLTPRRELILAFVAENPQCSSREVAEVCGLQSRHIGCELSYLAAWGYIESTKEKRRMYWTATGRHPQNPIDGEPLRQIITKSWSTKHSGHWLDFAICGRAA